MGWIRWLGRLEWGIDLCWEDCNLDLEVRNIGRCSPTGVNTGRSGSGCVALALRSLLGPGLRVAAGARSVSEDEAAGFRLGGALAGSCLRRHRVTSLYTSPKRGPLGQPLRGLARPTIQGLPSPFNQTKLTLWAHSFLSTLREGSVQP